MSAPPIIREFLVYCETIKNKSALTVSEQFLDLKTFFRYLLKSRGLVSSDIDFKKIDISCVDENLVKTVTLNDIYMFLIYCKNERGNSPKSRARKCSTLRSYFNYLTNNKGILKTNPAALLETPKFNNDFPKYLTLDESKTLLANVDGKNYYRDYCILTLFLNCGLRLSELCSINISDIKDKNIIITGKGNKQRLVHLNDACMNAIENYLKVRPHDSIKPEHKDALFVSQQNKRISNKTVQHIVYTYLEKSGLGGQGYSAHKLRHTAATLMYRYGNVDIRALKDVLGHENLNTTQIYTHVSDQQIEKAFDNNPLASVVQSPRKSDENNNSSK
jgi:site-specific recombinase xerD